MCPGGFESRSRGSIDALANDARTAWSTILKGHKMLCRFRAGDYRVIYSIDDTNRSIVVTMVRHRREVYRNL
jgi:mRNA interferase RelE/StbE